MKKKFILQEQSPNPPPPAVEGPAFDLRQQAETRLQKHSIHTKSISSQDPQRLIHELQVHQIELEMQNEELMRARDEAAAGLERYTDLYDFAPAGYFTLTNNGTIREANLTGANLLGVERANLIGGRFGLFVENHMRSIFNHFLEQIFASGVKQVCEVSLQKKNKLALWARIEGLATPHGLDCHTVVVDISERRQAEEKIMQLNAELDQRIQERTAALEATNLLLEEKIDELERSQESLNSLFTRYRIVAENTYDWEWWLDGNGTFLYSSPSCKRITGYDSDEFLQDSTLLQRILHADDLPIWQKHVAEDESKKTGSQIEFRIQHKDGSIYWIGHVCQSVFDEQGRFLGTRGNNRDISERKQAEDEIRKHVTRSESLLRVSARLNARLELNTLLRTLCQEVTAALNAPAAWINLYDAEQETYYYGDDYGMPSGFKDDYQALQHSYYDKYTTGPGSIIIIADAQNLMDTPNHMLFLAHHIRTLAVVAMLREGQPVGVLNLISFGECRRFREDELTLLKGLAEQGTQALVNTRLFEQVSSGQKRLQALSKALIEIQETERRTLALELHDEFGQALSAAKMSVAIIPTLPQDSVDRQLEHVQTILGDLVGRVRRLALELRPSMLDDKGLLAALLWLFDNYQSQSGETIAFEHLGMERRFPPQVEITAYRIVQEALTNIMRHAGNRQVVITIQADEQTIHLQIRDFGIGFEPAVTLANSASSGLSGMFERAHLVNGKITIESAPGKGTHLTVRLPIMALQESG